MNAIESYCKTIYPTLKTVKQNVPTTPTADTFVVRFQRDSTESETAYHMLVEREYQLLYFASSVVTVLERMDVIRRKAVNDLLIPLNDGSLRYIRITGFNVSQPFKNEGGLDVINAVMQAEVRQARDQETYEKMMNIYARYE